MGPSPTVAHTTRQWFQPNNFLVWSLDSCMPHASPRLQAARPQPNHRTSVRPRFYCKGNVWLVWFRTENRTEFLMTWTFGYKIFQGDFVPQFWKTEFCQKPKNRTEVSVITECPPLCGRAPPTDSLVFFSHLSFPLWRRALSDCMLCGAQS